MIICFNTAFGIIRTNTIKHEEDSAVLLVQGNFSGEEKRTSDKNEITGKFLIIWIAIVIAVSIMDYVVQPYFTKITGGSPLAVRYSIAGMVAGMIFFPPFGIIAGSFIGALIAEFVVNKKPLQNSLLAAFGAFLGFIFGTGLKLAASVTMLYYLIRFIF